MDANGQRFFRTWGLTRIRGRVLWWWRSGHRLSRRSRAVCSSSVARRSRNDSSLERPSISSSSSSSPPLTAAAAAPSPPPPPLTSDPDEDLGPGAGSPGRRRCGRCCTPLGRTSGDQKDRRHKTTDFCDLTERESSNLKFNQKIKRKFHL